MKRLSTDAPLFIRRGLLTRTISNPSTTTVMNSSNMETTPSNPPPTYTDTVAVDLKELEILISTKMKEVNEKQRKKKKLESKIKLIQEEVYEIDNEVKNIMLKVEDYNKRRGVVKNNYVS
jgi:peptidoglycan hydrolase CwlO-like protein